MKLRKHDTEADARALIAGILMLVAVLIVGVWWIFGDEAVTLLFAFFFGAVAVFGVGFVIINAFVDFSK